MDLGDYIDVMGGINWLNSCNKYILFAACLNYAHAIKWKLIKGICLWIVT